jgi:hypothetical protein
VYLCTACWLHDSDVACPICWRGYCLPCAGLHRHRVALAVTT